MSDAHNCPADGCSRLVSPQHLMCPRHWGMVAHNLQHRLYRAYDRGRGQLSDAHQEAMRACIEDVNRKLGHSQEETLF